jgi:hypothetical protein
VGPKRQLEHDLSLDAVHGSADRIADLGRGIEPVQRAGGDFQDAVGSNVALLGLSFRGTDEESAVADDC